MKTKPIIKFFDEPLPCPECKWGPNGNSMCRKTSDFRNSGCFDGRPLTQEEKKKRQKFNAQPVVVDGERWASKGEYDRWCELLLAEQAGAITELRRQVRFDFNMNGVHIGSYTADAVYRETDTGQLVVEDHKSEPTKTRDYKLRKKLMLACHGIAIREHTNG